MDAKSEAARSIAIAHARKRARRFRYVFVVVVLLAAVAIILLLSGPADEKMSWLTPEQMTQSISPGPLTRLKYRLERMLGPLQRFLPRSKKPLMECEGRLWSLPTASSVQLNLGAPVLTKTNGARAWILSADELAAFQPRIKASPGAIPVMTPRINTADGVQSEMSVGNNVLIGGKSVLVGLNINLLPKVSGDFYKLIVSVTDTDTNSGPTPHSLVLTTNFFVAGKVTVPNAGALVIDGGKAGDKNYWFVLSPVQIDATGKPIKH